MKRLILTLLIAFVAVPAFAGIKACNTVLVNQGLCVTTDQDLLNAIGDPAVEE
ncbi:MAG: hypothetical protein BWX64_02513 [Acidobacteria bacterium ADurb.Bin051]|jgi:hypothetical protein|nr:MAG: hypothetical protein BWX64_02513 [Acidobacteria bacterium ADurb.Bin051]